MAKNKTDNPVYFIGAGPGDPELLTVKGKRLLEQADVVIYAGSLINPEMLKFCSRKAEQIDSAPLCLDYIAKVMIDRAKRGQRVVRMHSGDPSVYSTIGEQMKMLSEAGIDFEVVPGVSSLGATAAALQNELTMPGVSQTVIITRAPGRTPVPERELISSLAEHQATMAIFLSAGRVDHVQEMLLEHYPPDTPAASVQHATWEKEKRVNTTVGDLADAFREAGIDRTAIILVGEALSNDGEKSKLYDKKFSHGYREGIKE